MQRRRRTDEFGNLIPVWCVREVVEEPLAAAQQEWGVRQVDLVDEAGAEILLDRGNAAG